MDLAIGRSAFPVGTNSFQFTKASRRRGEAKSIRRQPDLVQPAIPPTGPSGGLEAKPAIVPAGSKAGRTSQCAPLAVEIERGWSAGLSARRIYQDLVVERGFTGSYDAVKRFVRRLAHQAQPPFRRLECLPGQELQVDFGQGAWLAEAGKLRKTHLFRCVLSHSRKGYSEAVRRQTSESFLRCLENAFRHFGGVPATVVIDYVARHIIDLMFPAQICALTV